MKAPRVTFQWWVFFSGLFLALFEVILEVHVPGTDVFLFKEAGVNLATKGKFVAAYLPHMAFGEEMPFAYYPPVYPFIFGVWSWLFGVGLKQSLLFDSLLTLARTLLMLRLIVPFFSDSFFDKKARWFRLATGLFFCLLTVVSTDRDRPDELALVWGLFLCGLLNSAKENRVKILFGSLFLALVGATSPACGVLFGLLFSVWCLSQPNPFKVLLKAGMGTICFWALLVTPILLGDLGSGSRFSKQVGLSSFPYLRQAIENWTWKNVIESWLYYLNLFWRMGRDYISLAMGTCAASFVFFIKGSGKTNAFQRALVFSGLAFCLLVPLIWTLQPYYLWFSGMLLVVWVFQAVQRFNIQVQKGALFFLFGLLSPIYFWELKCILNAMEVPRTERSREIQKSVLAQVGAKAKLAVTHDQYFTFRSLKEVVNVDYWSHEAGRFDYLYITELPDSQRRTPRIRQILSESAQPCFELVKDFSTRTPFRFLGHPTKHFVRGNGGGLFKNICKDPTQTS